MLACAITIICVVISSGFIWPANSWQAFFPRLLSMFLPFLTMVCMFAYHVVLCLFSERPTSEWPVLTNLRYFTTIALPVLIMYGFTTVDGLTNPKITAIAKMNILLGIMILVGHQGLMLVGPRKKPND